MPWGIGIGTEKEKLVSLLGAETGDKSAELFGGHVLSGGLRHRDGGMKQIHRGNLR